MIDRESGVINGELSLDEMAKRFGGAGDGNQYHHVVTQGGANDKNIPQNLLQNTDNIVCLPTLLHEAVNAEYSQAERGKNMTKYQWLQTQPYDVQREEGLKILRKLHIKFIRLMDKIANALDALRTSGFGWLSNKPRFSIIRDAVNGACLSRRLPTDG